MESKGPRIFFVDMNGYEAFKGFINFIQMMGKTCEKVSKVGWKKNIHFDEQWS